jgi:soluble lytic murein transglycosylase
LVYEQTIAQQIYADWTFALIRQESAFMHDARSPVGAMGLMQLMPGTAKLVTRKAGEKYPGNRAMLEARTNIRIGTRYMASLFEQFDGNLLLATAGYNAGPHRSLSWQHPTQTIPGDLWVETIPIEETRDYVKNIMTYQAIYRWHLGQAPRLSSSLEQVPPRSGTQ